MSKYLKEVGKVSDLNNYFQLTYGMFLACSNLTATREDSLNPISESIEYPMPINYIPRLHRTVSFPPYSLFFTLQPPLHRTVSFSPYSLVSTILSPFPRTVSSTPYCLLSTVQSRLHRSVSFPSYSLVSPVLSLLHHTVSSALVSNVVIP